jgi:hypothetical protein
LRWVAEGSVAIFEALSGKFVGAGQIRTRDFATRWEAGSYLAEVSDPEQLHIWAKKAFLESYLRWDELEEGKFLLPDGELKSALSAIAETTRLPFRSREAK